MRIRKTLSIATGGVVRFRNPIENEFDKRRRKTKRENAREERIESGKTLGNLLGLKAYAPKAQPLPDPGWYSDKDNPEQLRWFDGKVWTEHYRQA